MKHKPIFLLMIFVLVTWACQSTSPTAIFTPEGAPIASGPKDTAIPSDTREPTFTPSPTKTPAPTNTPRPTRTPKPTLTPTPVPQLIELSGTGDMIVDVNKGDWPGTIHCVYNGQSNFVVINYDADGNYLDLLVNTIGRYDGTRLIDIKTREHTARLEVQASGGWIITIYPLVPEYVQMMNIPGTYSGIGDNVVVLVGGTPDVGTFDHQGDSNFVVISYGTEGSDLLVNDIGNYHGQAIVPKGTVLFEIQADGAWTIDVTSK